jgi:hypothetical protein
VAWRMSCAPQLVPECKFMRRLCSEPGEFRLHCQRSDTLLGSISVEPLGCKAVLRQSGQEGLSAAASQDAGLQFTGSSGSPQHVSSTVKPSGAPRQRSGARRQHQDPLPTAAPSPPPAPASTRLEGICPVCRTGYLSRINSARCEARDHIPALVPRLHRSRPEPAGTGTSYQPEVIPGAQMRAVLHQISSWWDGLPAPRAATVLAATADASLGEALCDTWVVPDHLARLDYTDIEAVAMHADVQAEARKHGFPLDARPFAAGVKRHSTHQMALLHT